MVYELLLHFLLFRKLAAQINSERFIANTTLKYDFVQRFFNFTFGLSSHSEYCLTLLYSRIQHFCYADV